MQPRCLDARAQIAVYTLAGKLSSVEAGTLISDLYYTRFLLSLFNVLRLLTVVAEHMVCFAVAGGRCHPLVPSGILYLTILQFTTESEP